MFTCVALKRCPGAAETFAAPGGAEQVECVSSDIDFAQAKGSKLVAYETILYGWDGVTGDRFFRVGDRRDGLETPNLHAGVLPAPE